MQRLVEGIRKFQQNVFHQQQSLFKQLADGQKPQALVIACSDSRVNPNLITQTEPGELFILRNAGNIVPPYGTAAGGESATIEYAVCVLGVRDIVVCGHSHCGAMGGILHPEKVASLPAVREWLGLVEATSRIMKEKYKHIDDPQALLTAAVEENVLVQLENLRTHPSVLAALGRGELQLHGWVYKFETGQVFAYDPQEAQFASVAAAPEFA